MAPPYFNNQLIINIVSTEISTSNIIVNRGIALNPTANLGDYRGYLNIPTGITAVVFGVPAVYQCYVRNIGPANSVSVGFTPQGGVAAIGPTLKPNGIFIPCWETNGDTTDGITQINFNVAAGPVNIEVFIGA